MYQSNPELIRSKIKQEVGKTTSLIAKDELFIHIPKIYENKGFYTAGKYVQAAGVFGYFDKDENFATSLSPSILEFSPDSITVKTVKDVDYYELAFEKGATITRDIRGIIQPKFVYQIYNIFVSSGLNCWFMDMEKLVRLLLVQCKAVVGEKFSNYSSIVELLTSPMYRNPDDITQTYREYLNQAGMTLSKAKPPMVIPLRDFANTSNNTLSKFMNSYFEQGLTNALITESNVITPLDSILRT